MRFWIWTSVLSTASFPPGSRASGCGSAMEGAANLERASSPNSNCFDFKRVVQNTPTCAGVEYVSLIWLCGTDSYALSSSSPLNRLILFYSMHHSFFVSLISRSCSSMARIECTTTLQSIEFSFRKAGLNVWWMRGESDRCRAALPSSSKRGRILARHGHRLTGSQPLVRPRRLVWHVMAIYRPCHNL